MRTAQPSLVRGIGTADAVLIGLGSMVGAGVFAVFAPAAQVAGAGLLLGLLVAAAVAYCNAVASAQLAASYPTSGGTYTYGRARLGPWWGFLAGWGFVVGKTASCAAMALTFAAYAVPGALWTQRLVAVSAVLGLAALNYRGIAKTALANRVLVALVLSALAVVVIAVWVNHPQHVDAVSPGSWSQQGIHGIVQSAALLFFAFAGYARIATLGEEVKDPARTIPRAIPLALGITVVVYVAVAVSVLAASGASGVAGAGAPLDAAVRTVEVSGLGGAVRVGAAVASLGALLALSAGVARTTLAMARNRDLPGWLAGVHPRFRTPHHADGAIAAVVSLLVLTADLRDAIGFSSFAVLVYYAIANVAAVTQPAEQRRWSRGYNLVGAPACIVLVASLPLSAIVGGLVVFTVGAAGRLASRRRPAGTAPTEGWPVSWRARSTLRLPAAGRPPGRPPGRRPAGRRTRPRRAPAP